MNKKAIIFILLLTGCTLASQGYRPDYYVDRQGEKVEITSPAEQCVLYKVVGVNTEYYKVGLFTANYAALKAGFFTPEQADAEIVFIEEGIDSPTATVGSVINNLLMVAGKASKVGAPEIILVAEGLDIYANDSTPIDDCTWYKLKTYIAKQKTLVHAFKKE